MHNFSIGSALQRALIIIKSQFVSGPRCHNDDILEGRLKLVKTCGLTSSAAGFALPKQELPPWQLHRRVQIVLQIIGPGLRPLFLFRQCGQAWGVDISKICRAVVATFWNRLSTSSVTIPSVNSFKRQLESLWDDLFIQALLYSPPSPQLRYSHP